MDTGNNHIGQDSLATEVHLYCCDPSSFADGDRLEELRRLLSAGELKRLDSFHFDRDRFRFLVSHAMLRLALSEYHDIEPSAWEFTSNSHGKPVVAGDQPVIEFNLSHTHGMCVVVVASGVRCGIDVEYMDRDCDYEGIAGRMFTADELEYMHVDPDAAHTRDRFYSLWTLRESYLKALGLGLSGNSGDFGFKIDDASGEASIVYHEGRPGDWGFQVHRPANRHVLSVCVEHGSTREVVKQDMQRIRARAGM